MFVKTEDKELAEGKFGDAMVTTIKGANEPWYLAWIPRFLLAPFFDFVLKAEAKKATGDDVPLIGLLSTIHAELELVKSTEGTLDEYRNVSAEVLLLKGGISRDSFKVSIDALRNVLPHSSYIELKGLHYKSAQDYGAPDEIARVVKLFFQS